MRGAEYLELPIADIWNALRDVKLLIMPYGSNFVNVGFLAPGATFLLLIDADAALRQIGELDFQSAAVQRGVSSRIVRRDARVRCRRARRAAVG